MQQAETFRAQAGNMLAERVIECRGVLLNFQCKDALVELRACSGGVQ
jgi:hypothetical protein